MHFTQLTKKMWLFLEDICHIFVSDKNLQNVCKYDGVRVLIELLFLKKMRTQNPPFTLSFSDTFSHVEAWQVSFDFFCTLYQLELIFTCATMPRDYRMQPTNS